MAIHDILRKLRKAQGLSQQQAAQFLSKHGEGVTQKAVSRWECGASQPNIEQFLLLCRLYGVQDVLSVFISHKTPGSRLNSLGKKRLDEYARLLEADSEFSLSADEEKERTLRTLPLYDLPVSAGTGQFLDSDRYELIDADDSVPLSADFAVRVSGDSMFPRFESGQVIYVKQQQTLSPGETGIFILNGEAYCKILSGDGKSELLSINSSYAPIKFSGEDEFRVLGKVLL